MIEKFFLSFLPGECVDGRSAADRPGEVGGVGGAGREGRRGRGRSWVDRRRTSPSPLVKPPGTSRRLRYLRRRPLLFLGPLEARVAGRRGRRQVSRLTVPHPTPGARRSSSPASWAVRRTGGSEDRRRRVDSRRPPSRRTHKGRARVGGAR